MKPSMKIHIEAPRNGRSQPKPLSVLERHGHAELALAGSDDRERADRHRRVRDQVVEERSRAELRCSTAIAISMKPACETDE